MPIFIKPQGGNIHIRRYSKENRAFAAPCMSCSLSGQKFRPLGGLSALGGYSILNNSVAIAGGSDWLKTLGEFKALQRAINAWSPKSVVVDGQIGQKTYQAVLRVFQEYTSESKTDLAQQPPANLQDLAANAIAYARTIASFKGNLLSTSPKCLPSDYRITPCPNIEPESPTDHAESKIQIPELGTSAKKPTIAGVLALAGFVALYATGA